MKRFSGWTCGAVALAIAVCGAPANATTAIELTTPGALFSAPLMLGFSFTVARPLLITGLGVFDESDDGLYGEAAIGLWDADNSAQFLYRHISAGAGTLDNHFRYMSIAPYPLTPGQRYVIAAYSLEAGTSFDNGQGGIGTIDPLIHFIQDRYNDSGRAEYPGQTKGLPGPWLGANFKFAITNVPEPASWVMLIGGFAMIGGTLRSGRRARGLLAAA